MARDPIPTWCIALGIVHDGQGRFLLVQELDGTWYFPAGPMLRGETWPETLQRVTFEEAGVLVAVQGLYRIEHRAVQDGARQRVLFVAQPLTRTCKTRADQHSLGARWFRLEDLKSLPLRNIEVMRILVDLFKGGEVFSADVLQVEGELVAMA